MLPAPHSATLVLQPPSLAASPILQPRTLPVTTSDLPSAEDGIQAADIYAAALLAGRPDVDVDVFREWFTVIVRKSVTNEGITEALLSLKGDKARTVLNALQVWLDCDSSTSPHDGALYRRGLYCLVKLATASGELPSSLFLWGVGIGDSRDPCNHGAYADIFRGTYRGMDVAVKRLRTFKVDSQKVHKMFCKEALVWRQLKHPNILPFLGIDVQTFKGSSHVCMVSPWLVKGTLAQVIETGQLDTIDRAKLLLEVAEGLSYLHLLKVVHGDIHCGNIFIDNAGVAKVADFGIATVGDETIGRMTTTAHAAGAMRWMAPERLNPTTTDGRPSTPGDVWAFGCLCLMVHTQLQPFHEVKSDWAIPYHVISGNIPLRPSEEDCQGCPLKDVWWELMVDCWISDALKRPLMSLVVDRIREILAGTCGRELVLDTTKLFTEASTAIIQSGNDDGETQSARLQPSSQIPEAHTRDSVRKRHHEASVEVDRDFKRRRLSSSSSFVAVNRSQADLVHTEEPRFLSSEETASPQSYASNQVYEYSSFPNDVLSLLFHYLYRDSYRTLTNAASTCRRWYNIAVENPDYWRRLHLKGNAHDVPCLLAVTTLSQESPIDAVITGRAAGGSIVHWAILCKLLRPHFNRIRSLAAHLVGPELRAFMSEWEPHLPALQALTLKQAPSYGRALRDEQSIVLSDSIITKEAPLLHLSLHYISVPWSQLRCYELHTLEITGIHPKMVPTMSQFLSTLVGLPQLRTLKLIDAAPSISEHSPSSDLLQAWPHVELHQLQSLTIDNRLMNPTLHLLGHISTPILSKLHLSSHVDAKTQGFSSFFPENLTIPLLSQLRSLHCVFDGTDTGTLSSLEDSDMLDLSLDLWTTYKKDGAINSPSFFSKLPDGLRFFKNITLLSLSDTGDGCGTPEEWERIFVATNKLERLIVNRVSCGRGEFGMFTALQGQVCGLLRSVTIFGTDISELDLDNICRTLLLRQRHGIPLRELHFYGTTGITDAFLSQLSYFVQVSWAADFQDTI